MDKNLGNSKNYNQENEQNSPQDTGAKGGEKYQKPEQIKQYWTEHRITLIAYEAQYMYNKKFRQLNVKQVQKNSLIGQQKLFIGQQNDQAQGNRHNEKQKQQSLQKQKGEQKQKQKQKKRKGRKKTDPQYQTAFLYCANKQKDELSCQDLKVEQIVKQFHNLNLLFDENNKDVDDMELKEFIKIMVQLKNSQIVKEFLPIYDLIIKQISLIKFQQVQKQKARNQVLKTIENKLLRMINSSAPEKFKNFKIYLINDMKQTIKLLYVEAYCFLAQKFNFNINQFYSEAFSITLQHGKAGNKKIKSQ